MFGKYKGQSIQTIPDDYLLWLAKPKYSGAFYKSLHSTELNWKVPMAVKLVARTEADRRGWKLKGETWER
jgi:hypothetical protein